MAELAVPMEISLAARRATSEMWGSLHPDAQLTVPQVADPIAEAMWQALRRMLAAQGLTVMRTGEPLNEVALVELVREAMGSGVAMFSELAAEGRMRPDMPLPEVFGNYPAEWLQIRRSLAEAAFRPTEAES